MRSEGTVFPVIDPNSIPTRNGVCDVHVYNVEAACETSPPKPLKDSSISFSDVINLYLQPPQKNSQKKTIFIPAALQTGDFCCWANPPMDLRPLPNRRFTPNSRPMLHKCFQFDPARRIDISEASCFFRAEGWKWLNLAILSALRKWPTLKLWGVQIL